jgi:hypothetical protein
MNKEKGFNLREADKACSPTEETRKKISKVQKEMWSDPDRIHPNKGHVMTDEQKEKLRQANLGKKQSEETIAKKIKSMTGKKRGSYGEEHKQKVKEARAKQVMPPWTEERRVKFLETRKATSERKKAEREAAARDVAEVQRDATRRGL